MHRRQWLTSVTILSVAGLTGCRGYQYGHVVKPTAPDLVGSHEAGAEVFGPLVDESVAKLLGAEQEKTGECPIGPDGLPMKRTICFVGIVNKSAEDIGDFKDQLYERIDAKIGESRSYNAISRRMVDSALYETRLRPDSLFLPDNQRQLAAILERQGVPFEYLLFATLTSGTTKRNSSSQRDYLLTLELVNIYSGQAEKQSAEIRKGYHKSAIGSIWNYNPLKR